MQSREASASAALNLLLLLMMKGGKRVIEERTDARGRKLKVGWSERFACTSERTTSLLNVRLLCLSVRVLPHTLIAGSPVAGSHWLLLPLLRQLLQL